MPDTRMFPNRSLQSFAGSSASRTSRRLARECSFATGLLPGQFGGDGLTDLFLGQRATIWCAAPLGSMRCGSPANPCRSVKSPASLPIMAPCDCQIGQHRPDRASVDVGARAKTGTF